MYGHRQADFFISIDCKGIMKTWVFIISPYPDRTSVWIVAIHSRLLVRSYGVHTTHCIVVHHTEYTQHNVHGFMHILGIY